jgi:hypothetical protein
LCRPALPLLLLLAALIPGAGAEPARHVLVIIDDPACVYCRRWHAEVGPAYANSPEGRFAPLLRRQRADPDIRFLENLAYTPTFILLAGRSEVGRIVGYAGEAFFWGQLEPLLARAGFRPEPVPPPNPVRETRAFHGTNR